MDVVVVFDASGAIFDVTVGDNQPIHELSDRLPEVLALNLAAGEYVSLMKDKQRLDPYKSFKELGVAEGDKLRALVFGCGS